MQVQMKNAPKGTIRKVFFGYLNSRLLPLFMIRFVVCSINVFIVNGTTGGVLQIVWIVYSKANLYYVKNREFAQDQATIIMILCLNQ